MTGLIIGWAMFAFIAGLVLGNLNQYGIRQEKLEDSYWEGYDAGFEARKDCEKRMQKEIDKLRDDIDWYKSREINRKVYEEVYSIEG